MKHTEKKSKKEKWGIWDQRLLLLQKYFTSKIAHCQDENLIRHYLREIGEIAKQRLQLRERAL